MTPDNAGQTVLADLDRLEAKAAPAPWYIVDQNDAGDFYIGPDYYVLLAIGRMPVPVSPVLDSEANAALTVHARNHLRPLVAALEGVAFWVLVDGSLCWCRHGDRGPDSEHHLPGCFAAREALAALQRDISEA